MRLIKIGDQEKVKNSNPIFLGVFGGHYFYKDTIYGDEATLLVKVDDVFYSSDFWDIPTIEEINESY